MLKQNHPGGDTAIELDVLKGTLGQDVIDIRSLGSKGVFTFDPGFTSTASCESKITFIDGDEDPAAPRLPDRPVSDRI